MAVVDHHAELDNAEPNNAELNNVELSGLDALENLDDHESPTARIWSSLWPKVAALVLALGIWQLVVWSGWKPSYTLPGPDAVLPQLRE